MGYECVPKCEEVFVEIYLEGDDTAYVIHKAGYAGSIAYRDTDLKVPDRIRLAINAEKEAWCPIHQRVLKWKNPS